MFIFYEWLADTSGGYAEGSAGRYHSIQHSVDSWDCFYRPKSNAIRLDCQIGLDSAKSKKEFPEVLISGNVRQNRLAGGRGGRQGKNVIKDDKKDNDFF